jgi:hypothetical protein
MKHPELAYVEGYASMTDGFLCDTRRRLISMGA